MSTTGALNGTGVFLEVETAPAIFTPIGGQTSHTETMTTGLLDITNKIGEPNYRELLPDEGMQEVTYVVEMIFVSQAGYDFVRAMAGDKSEHKFRISRDGIPEAEEINLMVQTFADTSSDSEPFTGTVTLLSSDEHASPLGPNLITNGDFATDTDWLKDVGWTIAAGLATSDGQVGGISQAVAITAGLEYHLDIVTATGTYVGAGLGIILGGTTVQRSIGADGTHEFDIVAGIGVAEIEFICEDPNDFIGNIDNVILRQVNP